MGVGNYARMGFVGYVRLTPALGNPINVRVTSADVKLSQEITYPDLVDSRVDQTVYQLGPQVVGGSLAFPLLHDLQTSIPAKTGTCGSNNNAASLAASLWNFALGRDTSGRLEPNNVFTTSIRYADNLGYEYGGCVINNMTFTVNQGEAVNATCEVIGGGVGSTLRTEMLANDVGGDFLSPARVITWNDAIVTTFGNAGQVMIPSKQIREFTCTVNNNVERFYGLNGILGPVDIAAKKREISGSLKTMGANFNLRNNAQANQDNFSSNSKIAFGYRLGAAAGATYWATGFYGVIWEIEEISLSTGLFETSTKWRATGDCDHSYLATTLGTSAGVSISGNPGDPQLPIPGALNFGANTNDPFAFTPLSPADM